MLSDAELERLRDKEKRNKVHYKFILVALPILVVFGFVSLDSAKGPVFTGTATVLSQQDTWTLKHGQRCQRFFDTPLGVTYDWRNGLCARHPWRTGQRVDVGIVKGRVTGWLFVDIMRATSERRS